MKCLFFFFVCFFTICSTIAQQTFTDKELQDFAKVMEDAANTNDGKELDKLFSINAFAKKIAMEDLSKSDIENMLARIALGKSISTSVGANGDFRFMKIKERGVNPILLFRLITDDQGMNYHEYEIVRENGTLKFSDILIYLSGENISETFNNLFAVAMQQKKGMNTIEQKKYIEGMKSFPQIRAFIQQKQPEKAMALFNTLDPRLRTQKTIRLYKIMITQDLNDDAQYAKAINEYKQAFPKATNINLILIDGYLLKKQYANALDAVDKLDAALIIDPYLDYTRYLINTMASKPDVAFQNISKAAAAFPSMEYIQLEYIATLKELDKKDELAKAVTSYKANKKFNQETLKLLISE